MLRPNLSHKQTSDMIVRGSWAHEHGVTANLAGDQTTAIRAFIRDVCARGGGTGKDRGVGTFLPGVYGLGSTCLANELVGVRIAGAGDTEAIDGPRNHGGWTPFLSGTQFVWRGSAGGGPVFEFQKGRNWQFGQFDLYLGEATGENHAAVGILFSHVSGFGEGRYTLERITIVSVDHGNTGIQIGTTAGQLNNDSGVFREVRFRNLDTCVEHNSAQNLCQRYINCEARECRRVLYVKEGGQSFIENLHVINANALSPLVIVQCDSGGFLGGHHEVRGGYVDRQAEDQRVTIFDYRTTTQVRCDGHVSDFDLRFMDGATPPTFDASVAAFFELSNMATVLAENCNLPEQPVVRFHSALSDDRVPQARLVGCTIAAVAVAGELVTAVGGLVGVVDFESCRRNDAGLAGGTGKTIETPFTASVGRPADGREDTHYDCDDFDGSDTGDFASSWVDTTHTVAGYWRMNEALGGTTINDLKGSGDLTVESDVLVARAPLGLLGPRSANWANQSTGAIDTGISLTPASSDYTFFAWLYLDDLSAEQVILTHDPASGDNLRMWQIDTSGNLSNGNASARDVVKVLPARRWLHLITVYDQSADQTINYINGTHYTTTTTAGIAALAAGNLHIGGDADAGLRARAHLSRLGVLTGALSAAEASLLFLKASVQANKPIYRPA